MVIPRDLWIEAFEDEATVEVNGTRVDALARIVRGVMGVVGEILR
jgi:hypothetical protein